MLNTLAQLLTSPSRHHKPVLPLTTFADYRTVYQIFKAHRFFLSFIRHFLPRDALLSAVYATAIPYVCLSVYRSVRHTPIKTAEHIIEILSLSDRTIILVFRHQGLLRKSNGNLTDLPLTGLQIQGGSDFRPMWSYISQTVIDRGIFTIEDEYKVAWALSNSAAFDDLE